jgi:hypothetical protein
VEVMADLGDFWKDIKDSKKSFKAKYGIPCPECKRLQPKRNPSILVPQQECRVDGYIDPRPRIEGQIN